MPILKQNGIACFPFMKIVESELDQLVWSQTGISGHRKNLFAYRRMLHQWLIGTIPQQISDLNIVLDQYVPDVLVTDPAMWAPFLVLSEIRNIPVAVFAYTASCMLPGPGIPPFGFGLPRSRHRLMCLINNLAGLVSACLMKHARHDVNALRHSFGLTPIDRSVTEFASQMPLYLIPSIPEFDYQRDDLPKSVHYVGPCLWDSGSESSASFCLEALETNTPLVYVSEGTMRSAEPFLLQAAIDAFSGTSLQVILTTGNHRDPETITAKKPASNIHIERFIPLSELLPYVDVVVTTGGSGTVLASLKAGVPVIVIPVEWDQPENAWRVADCGAGIRLPQRSFTSERLRLSVERLLTDSAFKKNAEKIANACKLYGGARQAADLLIRLAADAGVSSGRDGRACAGALPS